jgi:hypothetical protein
MAGSYGVDAPAQRKQHSAWREQERRSALGPGLKGEEVMQPAPANDDREAEHDGREPDVGGEPECEDEGAQGD